jgi:hypothetical protein
MSKYITDIEKRQFILKQALAKQSRLPLLSDDERALYEEYNVIHKMMEKQQLFCKRSLSLCDNLFEIYDGYIEKLQKLYDTMNSLDLNLSASYDTQDTQYREKPEYICWAENVEKVLRDVLEYPKHQIFCNENLFYNDGSFDETSFKPVFHFDINGTNFDIKSFRNSNLNKVRPDCFKVSLGLSNITIISAEWSVHNFNNFPVATNFPMEPDIYTSYESIDLTTFLHNYSEQLMAVHEHLTLVTSNKNHLYSDFIGCTSISESTIRYLKFLDDSLDELTHIDPDEIHSMIQNGNQLKNQLSELKIYDSTKKIFSGRESIFKRSGCGCDK